MVFVGGVAHSPQRLAGGNIFFKRGSTQPQKISRQRLHLIRHIGQIHNGGKFGVLHHVAELLPFQFPVDGYDHAHAATHRQIRQRPGIAVFAHHTHLFSIQSKGVEIGCKGTYVIVCLMISDLPYAAVLTESEGAQIAVQLGTAADQIPKRENIPYIVNQFCHC